MDVPPYRCWVEISLERVAENFRAVRGVVNHADHPRLQDQRHASPRQGLDQQLNPRAGARRIDADRGERVRDRADAAQGRRAAREAA